MISEGLGEMFEVDSSDICGGKFPFTSMGAERRVSRAQTRERGLLRRERNWYGCISHTIINVNVNNVHLTP